MHGAIIQKGPKNFQVIPRQNPYLPLYGTLRGNTDHTTRAQIRLVREDTGTAVVDWMTAHQDGLDWELNFGPLPAGGLYRLETRMIYENDGATADLRGDMVHHLGVGDLFLVAGQSNATGYGMEPVYDPVELGLSVLRENGCWDLASHPLSDGTGSIHDGNLEDINPRHSPWLHFARLVKQHTGFPVGLVPVSLGGSPISRWDLTQGGDLYKIMLKCAELCEDGPFTGILWYQGCSDAMQGLTTEYLEAFTRFVRDARHDLKNPELPVYTVQLNRDVYPFDDPELSEFYATDMAKRWGSLREMQRQAANKLRKVYIVPAHDLQLCDNVHNSAAANIVIGQRMAYSVLQNGFGMTLPGRAPNITKARLVSGFVIDLVFDDVFGSLTDRKSPVDSLAISVCDEDGNVPLSSITAQKNTVKINVRRQLKGKVTVSAAAGYDYMGWPPHDTASGMPLLAFYDVSVERI
jgi:hypothetical protein